MATVVHMQVNLSENLPVAAFKSVPLSPPDDVKTFMFTRFLQVQWMSARKHSLKDDHERASVGT